MAAATGIERPNPTLITALRMRAFLLARVTADECWRVVSPTQALNCTARLNCLKSPTVATAARAPTGPMPINVAAFFTPALSLACAAMRSSHQAMWASSARRCACACCTHSRARVFISLPASSSVSMSTASSAAGPCAKKCICGRRAAGGFTHRSGVVGVVLAAGTFASIRADKLDRNDACVQAQHLELARPMVRAGARLHGHDAAGGQLRAPGDKLVQRQGADGEHLPGGVHGMHLQHPLCQIDPHANGLALNDGSRNLLHGTSPFHGLRLMTLSTANLAASTPLPEGGKSLRIPVEERPLGVANNTRHRTLPS